MNMTSKELTLLLALLNIFIIQFATSLDNGLAKTPPMGLSTWSAFQTDINDTLVRQLADAMVLSGLLDAGYEYLLLDDGWQNLPPRNENGELVADKHKFPFGLKATVDYVHSKGLKLGLWFGHSMCISTDDISRFLRKNSKKDNNAYVYDSVIEYYATIDATFFAANGVDAIKHDNCVDVENSTVAISKNFIRFNNMKNSLNTTGRPILFDVVLQVAHERAVPSYDYGYIWSPEPYGKEAVQSLANSWWSLPFNKYNCWRCCIGIDGRNVSDTKCMSMSDRAAWRGLLPMIDIQDMGIPGFVGHFDWAGPGGWNHLDQLSACMNHRSYYGMGLRVSEQRAQVSIWSILASPLIVSFDVRQVSSRCLEMVTNPHVIAVHQDPLGLPGRRLKNIMAPSTNGNYEQESTHIVAQIWYRKLSNGAVAVVFFNRDDDVVHDMNVTFLEIGFAPNVVNAKAVDVWSGDTRTQVTSPFTAFAVKPHDVTFIILTAE